MAAILYFKKDGVVERVKVQATDVDWYLNHGYKTSAEGFDELTRDELKAIAEPLGIKIGKKSNAKLLEEIEDAQGRIG